MVNEYHINNKLDLVNEVIKFLESTDLLYTNSLSGENYDMLILTPCSGFNGLCIVTNIISEDQQNFLNILGVECNYFCLISNDLVDIISRLTQYIDGSM